MIHKIGQVMLYVKNQDQAVRFWEEKVGFSVLSIEENGQGMKWVEMAPTKDAETSIIIHDKEIIAKMSPEVNLGTPSLLFFSDDVEKLRQDLVAKNVKVGEIVDMPSGKVFNFADDEGQYFAVMEKR